GVYGFFFFSSRRRHTILQGDWSSDVCSSDLGGPAEWLIETRGSDEIVTALRLARRLGVDVTVLGGGSNVLVADAGVLGLVIRPRGGEIAHAGVDRVRADSAVTINGLVRWTINHGCAGLEAWAGTPGTVGGAVFGNAHFGGRLIGELVTEVRLASRDGATADVRVAAMAFGYDRSRLQGIGDLLLSAVFRVTAREIRTLIERCRVVVRERFNVELRDEIVYLGQFDQPDSR